MKVTDKRHMQTFQKGSAAVWIVLAVVLVGVIAGVGILTSSDNTPTEVAENLPQTDSIPEVGPADNIIGNEAAAITLVEYSDFQCPACKAQAPRVKEILNAYPDDVRLVYRHFPLRTIHANAQDAAIASEAAGRQNQFLAFHDLLFDRQEDWSSSPTPRRKFREYAEELGLNVDQFNDDMSERALADKVNADFDGGNAAGVQSTPTFFINGDMASLANLEADLLTYLEQPETTEQPEGEETQTPADDTQ